MRVAIQRNRAGRRAGATKTAVLAACAALGVQPAGAQDATNQGESVTTTPTMPEVVVSASRVPQPSDEVGSAVTVITEQEIEQKQARFVTDVLRDTPGVSVTQQGPRGTLTEVRIRGAAANQTLVLIDGVEVNDPSAGSQFDFASLTTDNVERIEILRGPQSALYGSDAIGGVVNVITKRGEGPPTVRLRGEGGSFGTAEGAFSLSGGGENHDFSLGASAVGTEGVSVAEPSNGGSEEDGYLNQTYNARVGLDPIENLELDFTGRFVDSVSEFDPLGNVNGFQVPVDGDNEQKNREVTGQAQAKYTLLDGDWEHIVRGGGHRIERTFFTNGAQTFVGEGRSTQLDYQTNYFFETPGFAEATHSLTFLAERETEAQSGGVRDVDITNYGYVGEYRGDFWNRVFLTGSLRYDDNDIFEDATTFRITGAYLHRETDTRLHASVGTGVKNPTLAELFGFGPTFRPNPNLEPEQSTGWDAGVEQRFWNDRALVDVTVFQNRIEDLITTGFTTSTNTPGTSEIVGVELTGDVELFDGLRLQGQYTYTDAENPQGQRLQRRPEHRASVNANYSFLEDRANVNLGVNYVGEQTDVAFRGPTFTQSRVELEEYVLVNLAGSYEIFEGISLVARVENLLDEEYQEVFGYNTPGIGAYAGVQASFDLY
jgi:vitamin B12 transporter